jgi:Zn ribbon nucleic-acid-binding protein
MNNNSIQIIQCQNCGHELARVEEKGDKKQLIVHPPKLDLHILSKQPDVFVAVCPGCKSETVVDAELLKRF